LPENEQASRPTTSPGVPESDTEPRAFGGLSRNVVVLSVVSFLTDMHSEMLLPLLPGFYERVLHLNKTAIGIIEGIAEANASLLKMVSGWWSDAVGRRKPFVVAGYTLSAASKPFLAFATSGLHAIAVRFADRTGKGLRTSPRDALIADSSTQAQRGKAYGFHRMTDTGGAIMGTLLAYGMFRLLAQDYRKVFLWATIPGVIAIAVLVAGVREVAPRKRTERKAPSLRGLTRPFKVLLCAHTLFSLGNFSYAFFLLRAQELGVAPALAPLIYLAYNIVYAACAYPVGSLSDRTGGRVGLVVAYGTYAATCAGLAVSHHSVYAWLLFALYGVHSAVVETVARSVASQSVEPERRGAGLGLFHMLLGLAAFPASLFAGLLGDRVSPVTPFVLGAALALAAAGVVWVGLPARLKAS